MLFEIALAKQKFVVSVIWGTIVVQMGLEECLNMMRMTRIIRNAIDWCCFYYFLRNSLVALLEALFARQQTSSHN